MLIPLLLAGALVSGAHPVAVAAVLLAAWRPTWFLMAAALWGVYARWSDARRLPDPALEESAFLQGLAAELTAGGSLRTALREAATRAPGLPLEESVRLASSGRPASEVAVSLAAALPVNGRLAGAAFRVASVTGGRATEIFGNLAVRAAEARRLELERRTTTAQVRSSARLLAGAPLAGVGILALNGRMGVFLDFGAGGVVILAAGLTMVGAGAAWIWLLWRRGSG